MAGRGRTGGTSGSVSRLEDLMHHTAAERADLRNAARDAMRNVVVEQREVTGEAGDRVKESAAALVRSAADVSAEIAAIARASIEGAIQGASAVGADPSEAASMAAMGAIEAAGDIGGTALDQVQKAVVGTIDGVKIAPRVPFD